MLLRNCVDPSLSRFLCRLIEPLETIVGRITFPGKSLHPRISAGETGNVRDVMLMYNDRITMYRNSSSAEPSRMFYRKGSPPGSGITGRYVMP